MIKVSSFGKHQNEWRDDYIRRLKRLMPFEWQEIPLKKCPDHRTPQLLAEEKRFLDKNKKFSILDVTGKSMTSDHFSKWCFKESERHLVIGPAIGFHQEFFLRADFVLKLSDLTFTHALAQLVLAESLYRVICERKNHPFCK